MSKRYSQQIATAILCSFILSQVAKGLIPIIDSHTAVYKMLNGESFRTGQTYLINDNRLGQLNAIQSIPQGVIVGVKTAYLFPPTAPDRFMLITSRQIADDTLIPGQLCGTYYGVFHYDNLQGTVSTINQFRETKCPSSLNKYIVISNANTLTTKPKTPYIPDLKRWSKVFDDSKQQVYIDNSPGAALTSVDPDDGLGTNYPVDPTVPQIQIYFWARYVNQDAYEDKHLRLHCRTKTINEGIAIGPETPEEAMYKGYCLSPQTKAMVQKQQNNQQQLQREQLKAQQRKQQTMNALQGLQTIFSRIGH